MVYGFIETLVEAYECIPLWSCGLDSVVRVYRKPKKKVLVVLQRIHGSGL